MSTSRIQQYTTVGLSAIFSALLSLVLVPGFVLGNDTFLEKSTWFVDKTAFDASAHASFTCEECHGTMTEGNKTHPDPQDQTFLKKDIFRTYDYSSCKRCHPESYKQSLKGAHAKALEEELTGKEIEEGEPAAPTCGNCHSSHYVKGKQSRVETGIAMIDTCGVCHPEAVDSYLENYHGKSAVYHKAEDSAYCTDCHGAHECRSLKDKEDALAACRRCHPEANEQFAGFVIHASLAGLSEDDTEKAEKVTAIHRVEIIGLMFVLLVLGFFYFHSIIWFLRRMHEKLRKR
jgi:hypothetical protein